MAPARKAAPNNTRQQKEQPKQRSPTNAKSFRKGDVYCLANFTCRAEEWYRQEVVQRTGSHRLDGLSREGDSVRRQPSRMAKQKPAVKTVVERPYILADDEVEALRLRVADQGGGQPLLAEEPEKLHATSAGQDVCQDANSSDEVDLQAHVAFFCVRLNKAIHEKTGELKALYDRTGIRHICTIVNSSWQCLDEEYCGHGLVERCMRWIPEEQEAFQQRVRSEMDQYLARTVFSLEAAKDRADALKVLKQRRYAELKNATTDIIAGIVEEYSRRSAAVVDAHMLATPTLGKWTTRGFDRESVEQQTVALGGLVFAVDVCQGEMRLMML